MPTALFSVYEKTGVVDFAQRLHEWGWTLLASKGTAKVLNEAGISATHIADIVGEPILGHRVVTLSREIHAGLLAQRTAEDCAELARLGIPFIDLVYVNLYPLVEELSKSAATIEDIIEKTDIGGPTLLRAAAKGRRFVICSLEDAIRVAGWLTAINGKPEPQDALLRELAANAEKVAASYTLASAIAQCPHRVEREGLHKAYLWLTGHNLEVQAKIY